jgi:hypothetical protein
VMLSNTNTLTCLFRSICINNIWKTLERS